MPLSCNSPAALDAPFARFVPAALKSFRHPGGGYPFLTETPRRGTKILRRLRRGYAFFTGAFPENYHLPKREILNSPLGLQLCLKVWALLWASIYLESTPDPGSIQDRPLFETGLYCFKLRID